MIGILIVTHGKMGTGIIDALSLIMGEQEQYKTLGLCHGDDIGGFKENIKSCIKELDSGQGVLVLADLFSASPYNQTAMSFNELKDHDVRLISGVNLPMVIEAFNQRFLESDLETTYRRVMKTGVEGIKEFLEEMEKIKK